MSIKSIIEEAIGEDKPTGFIGENSHLDTTFFKQEIGYKQALADLRNKIPEIEKKIIELLEEKLVKYNVLPPQVELENPSMWEGHQRAFTKMRDIIKNLTS